MSGRMGDSGRGTTLRGQDIILAYARTQRSQENTGALAKGLNITNGEAMQLSKSFSQASFGSDRLEDENPRFDRARFRKACGLGGLN